MGFGLNTLRASALRVEMDSIRRDGITITKRDRLKLLWPCFVALYLVCRFGAAFAEKTKGVL